MSKLRTDSLVQLDRMLRERARELRLEIRETLLHSAEAHHRDVAGMVSDVGDESVANMLADLDIAAVERDVGELREVENALSRVRAGEYGVCMECGADIGYFRLKANPAAARCVPCQSRRERASAGLIASL